MFEAPLRICCPFPGIKQWSTFEPDPTVTIPQPLTSSPLSPPFQEQDHSIQIRFYSERERKWDRHAAWSRSTALCPLPFCHRSTREVCSGKEGRGAARQRQRFQAASRQTKRRPNQPKTSRGGRTDLTWAVAGGQQRPNWLQLPSGLRMTSPLDCVSCNCKSQHRVVPFVHGD